MSAMSDRSGCPTCGQAVQVVTSGEGTSHYVGVDAWDASTLRTERDAAVLSATMDLRQVLRELVRLKDGPRDDAYRAAKDAAWDAARAALEAER